MAEQDRVYLSEVYERREEMVQEIKIEECSVTINGISLGQATGTLKVHQTFTHLYDEGHHRRLTEPRKVDERATLELEVAGLPTKVSKASRP